MVYQEARFRNRNVPNRRETLAASKQDFKLRIRGLLEMSKQHLNNEEPPSKEGEQKPKVKEAVPNLRMSFGRSIVIKRDTPVNVPLISAYRKWLRAEQRMADLLADINAKKAFLPMRLAAMAGAEERLKQTGELVGLLPPDAGPPNLRVQDILHRYYNEIGLPTADDKAMLTRFARVNIPSIDRWFQAKESRMSATRSMDRMIKFSRLTHMNTCAMRIAWKPQLPETRH